MIVRSKLNRRRWKKFPKSSATIKTSIGGYAATSPRRRTPPLRQTSSATSPEGESLPHRGKQVYLVCVMTFSDYLFGIVKKRSIFKNSIMLQNLTFLAFPYGESVAKRRERSPASEAKCREEPRGQKIQFKSVNLNKRIKNS